ncbi:MAG TPA: 30S ribosomal protein S13 [Cytophagales bacterium]|jgi:small subunit ribosomal protein S13|nr:30S ribosomal protein S13 [Cytophagales bacterium]
MRIAGIDIPDNKRGEIALTYIFGIGNSSAQKILFNAGIDLSKKVNDWSEEESNKIRNIISESYKIEGDLKSEVRLNIKRLLDIGCYRGIRHRIGLPLRGQKTKNNSRTRKGKRKTVANKKKAIK